MMTALSFGAAPGGAVSIRVYVVRQDAEQLVTGSSIARASPIRVRDLIRLKVPLSVFHYTYSKQGGILLLYRGYTYHNYLSSEHGIQYWRCSRRCIEKRTNLCKAKCRTLKHQVVHVSKLVHTCNKPF